MNERPGPCERCDWCDGDVDGHSDYRCVGVPIEGTRLREHHRCAQYRRWWDAGYATARKEIGPKPEPPGAKWVKRVRTPSK